MKSIKGVAFITDLDRKVLEILQDDFGLFRTGVSNDRMASHFTAKSLPKLEKLILRIQRENRKAIFQQFLVAVYGSTEVEMEFQLVRLESDRILWSGSRSEGEEREYFDGLMRINNENINELRKLLKKEAETEDPVGTDHQMYDELTRMNSDLATTQRTLAKKTHELEQSNALKNQVIGMAAHDLRNPLSVILNFSEFLLDESDSFSEQQVEFIREIQNSSRLMLSIVEELLDISAIEAGRVSLTRERIDVGEWVESSANLYRGRAERKEIQLEVRVPETPVWCHVDGNKIRQIVNNLVSNAIKFSDGGTSVSVLLEKNGQTDELVMTVQDQGQGIPADELHKLFVPFSKISVQSTDEEKSTGLGLAITQKLVQAHNGEIRVDSTPGEGSEFVVTIPCDQRSPKKEEGREGIASSDHSSFDSDV
ncbi:MAG: sensor histidine kinase [Bacteroidota bacterium]